MVAPAPSRAVAPTIGVLALQGAFRAHAERLLSLGAHVAEVRTPAQLDSVDALVMPGGESTTMSNLLVSSGLYEPVGKRLAEHMPVFGTCAGMILLAGKILDGRDDQHSFGTLDITVRRNGYGRQINSFETDITVAELETTFHAVFIRAPRVESVGREVEVLACHDGDPVLVRHDNVLAASFHPELTRDTRLHEMFVDVVEEIASRRGSAPQQFVGTAAAPAASPAATSEVGSRRSGVSEQFGTAAAPAASPAATSEEQ